jgi:hypothetical protein
MTNQLNYSFGSPSVTLSDGQLHTYQSMGVAEPYDMLSPIGDVINDPVFIGELLMNLDEVMQGRLTEYRWGCDMALVQSFKEKSIVEYMDEKDGAVGDFHVEIPTAWLYELMKDWKKFLEEHPLYF